jgi:hypothetical protein
MSRGHTYDKWQELGCQVKRGETYSFKHYGNKCFTRDQVVRIEFDEEEDDSYVNHCWNCKETVDSDDQDYCSDCNWLVCSNCGCCGCQYDDE